MNKLIILTLAIMTSAASVYGIEPEKKLLPISSLQTYLQLSTLLTEASGDQDNSFSEILQHIFSFQLETSGIDFPLQIEQNCKSPDMLIQHIKKMIASYGYNASAILFKKYYPHEKISICNIKNGRRMTTLHCAAELGYAEMVKFLLHAAGDKALVLLTQRCFEKKTALHMATDNGHTKTIRLLLDAAGDKASALLTMQNMYGTIALHYAVCNSNTKIVTLLLNAAGNKASALLTMQSIYGATALRYARNTEMAKLLLDAASDKASALLTVQDCEGKTVLHVAASLPIQKW